MIDRPPRGDVLATVTRGAHDRHAGVYRAGPRSKPGHRPVRQRARPVARGGTLRPVAILAATRTEEEQVICADIAPGAIFLDDRDLHPSLRVAA